MSVEKRGGQKLSKIIFVNPPVTLEDMYGDLAVGGNRLPPMGLLYLAAVTREAGFETEIVDCVACGYSYSQAANIILKKSPKYVGITATTMFIHHAAKLAQMIKEKDDRTTITVGGPHITADPIKTLEKFPHIDIGVIGEGEHTVVELLNTLENGGDIEKVRGLVIRSKNIKLTERRPLIQDLDALLMPAFDLLPKLSKFYGPPLDGLYRLPSASLITSRGCPMQCTFCDRNTFGNTLRAHGAEYVMKMIKELYYKYGIREIHIWDDNFAAYRKRLIELCNMLIEEKMDLNWCCMASVNFVNPEILRLMKKAGCWQIAWGIESASQEILDVYKKKITPDKVRQALKWTKEAGIRNKGFFIIGNFKETEDTLKQSLDYLLELPLDEFHTTYLQPYIGSEAHAVAAKYGTYLDSEWDEDWKLKSAYSPTFVPSGLSKEILERYYNMYYIKFYLRPRIILYFLTKVSRGPREAAMVLRGFMGFFKFLIKNLKMKNVSKV